MLLYLFSLSRNKLVDWWTFFIYFRSMCYYNEYQNYVFSVLFSLTGSTISL